MSIVIDHVTKSFGDVVAVSDVSTEIGPGITALLGPNGAGKSTLFRMMVGLTKPTTGTIEVLGANVRDDIAVRARLSLVPQQDALFDRLNAEHFVELSARTYGVADVRMTARWALDQVGLADVGPKPIGTFSKGMRQRIKIAAALVNDPEVMILDEPLNGLDPVQRRHLTALFHRLGNDGRTLVVSSHVLEEVARLGSRILVIAQGRLAAAGDFHALRNLMDDRPQRIRIGTDRPRDMAAELVRQGYADGLTVEATGVIIETNHIDAFRYYIAGIARDHGLRLHEIQPLDDDLESVFRYVVGAS